MWEKVSDNPGLQNTGADEYVVVGERDGRWLREHRWLPSAHEARAAVFEVCGSAARASPGTSSAGPRP